MRPGTISTVISGWPLKGYVYGLEADNHSEAFGLIWSPLPARRAEEQLVRFDFPERNSSLTDLTPSDGGTASTPVVSRTG